jgi:hypothetical protein
LGEAKYNPVFEMDEDDELDMKQVVPVSPNNTGMFAEADDEDEMNVNDLDADTDAAIDQQISDLGGAEGAVGDGGPEAGPEPPVEQPEAGEEVADMPDAAPEEDPMADPMAAEPAQPSADEQREDIQNQLIKLQLTALEQMNDKMKTMDMTMADLKNVMGRLSQDVEEVREPTNVEKVAQRKQDSHPYYYRLNDLWQGNAFQARLDDGKTGEFGMKQLEDGTYVADFDDFPQLNDLDIKKSF